MSVLESAAASNSSDEKGSTFPRGFSRGKVVWPLVRAGSLFTLNYGRALVEGKRRAGCVPVYGTNGRCGWHDEPLSTGPAIILGRKGMGPLGVEWCDGDFWVIDTAYYVTPNEAGLNLKFYYYLIKYIGLNHLKDGTSNPSLSRDTFYAQSFPFPPSYEQEAIARVISALDDKIELNRRMNETLEAMARALFKSWFVDFDPVRAKAEKRQPAGIDAETAKLFPESFEESLLGLIPRGWRVATLNDITESALGGDWGNDTPAEDASDAALCIRGADIPDLQKSCVGKMPVRHLKNSSLQKRSLRDGDLVIEISGGSPTQSTGRPVLVTKDLLEQLEYPLVCSNFCRMVRLSNNASPIFAYLWLRWLYASDAFLQYENGTTGIKNLAFSTFSKDFYLALPPSKLLKNFEGQVGLLFKKQAMNGAQSRTLAALRDALLPKLLSGEIRVRDAEREVEQVA